MKRLIDKLRHYHSLTGEEYANLLSCQDTGTLTVFTATGQGSHFGTFREWDIYPRTYRGEQPMS